MSLSPGAKSRALDRDRSQDPGCAADGFLEARSPGSWAVGSSKPLILYIRYYIDPIYQ